MEQYIVTCVTIVFIGTVIDNYALVHLVCLEITSQYIVNIENVIS